MLSAIIGMLSAINRNHCPQSIGTPVRNRRNPQRVVGFMMISTFRSRYGYILCPGESKRQTIIHLVAEEENILAALQKSRRGNPRR
jgi:hypothetical protein